MKKITRNQNDRVGGELANQNHKCMASGRATMVAYQAAQRTASDLEYGIVPKVLTPAEMIAIGR